MSGPEIGNKTLLRRVADALQMLSTQQAPAQLNMDDLKAVIDVGRFNPLGYSEFGTYTAQLIDAASESVQDIALFRVGGLTANGAAIFQVGTGIADDGIVSESGDNAEDAQYDYRILGCTALLECSGGNLTAEDAVGGAFQADFYLTPSDAVQQALELAIPGDDMLEAGISLGNINQGFWFETEEEQYRMSPFGYNTDVEYVKNTTSAMWIPGFLGSKLMLRLIHRDGGPGGSRTVWAGDVSVKTFTWGVKIPRSERASF